MNRQIKFRAWLSIDNAADDFKMIDWSDSFFTDMSIVTGCSSVSPKEDKNCILMQYSGLEDSNGVEIYEGDIVSITDVGRITAEFPFIELYKPREEDYMCVIEGNIYEKIS